MKTILNSENVSPQFNITHPHCSYVIVTVASIDIMIIIKSTFDVECSIFVYMYAFMLTEYMSSIRNYPISLFKSLRSQHLFKYKRSLRIVGVGNCRNAITIVMESVQFIQSEVTISIS